MTCSAAEYRRSIVWASRDLSFGGAGLDSGHHSEGRRVLPATTPTRPPTTTTQHSGPRFKLRSARKHTHTFIHSHVLNRTSPTFDISLHRPQSNTSTTIKLGTLYDPATEAAPNSLGLGVSSESAPCSWVQHHQLGKSQTRKPTD